MDDTLAGGLISGGVMLLMATVLGAGAALPVLFSPAPAGEMAPAEKAGAREAT